MRAHTWSRWWVWTLVNTGECSVRARTPTWGCGLVKKNGHVRGGHDHFSSLDRSLMLGFSLCETLISIVLCALSSWCFCALRRCARQWLLVSGVSESLEEFWNISECFKVSLVCLYVPWDVFVSESLGQFWSVWLCFMVFWGVWRRLQRVLVYVVRCLRVF